MWISTKERLPEVKEVTKDFYSSKTVLVLMGDGSYEMAKYQKSDINNWSGWYNPSYDDNTDFPEFWAELPPPPTK